MPKAASYECYPEFVIRTPVFSLDTIKEIPKQFQQLSGFVIEQWKNPVVKDAFLLASPVLFKQLNSEVKKGHVSIRVSNSFVRYFLRMCYRSTPFGLFAGVGTGEISGETNIYLTDIDRFKAGFRLDMEYLGAFVMSLASDKEIRPFLKYQTNSSLYRIGSTWRYVEVSLGLVNRKQYRVVSVDSNVVVESIIEFTSVFRTYPSIVKIIEALGYTNEESLSFLGEMIDAQLLIPDILPSLTGKEFSAKLHDRLATLPGCKQIVKEFDLIQKTLLGITTPGGFNEKFEEIVQMANNSKISFNKSHLVQADLRIGFQRAEISKEISNKVLLGIRILKSLSRPRPYDVLGQFKKQFLERYGSRDISLQLIMDTENGIGLDGLEEQQLNDPSPLLDGLDFPIKLPIETSQPPHPFLLSKIDSFSDQNSTYIELTKRDLRQLDLRAGNWSDQLFAFCYLAGNKEDITVFLDLASSGNTAHINARFGFLDSARKLNKHMREMIDFDKNQEPECLYAEVVHLPEDRTGNILQRPSFYDWEIPYLANPGGEAGLIKPDEILVSVEKGKVILKRENDGRRIIPRLTNAHNYKGKQLPLYKFLAECAHQDAMGGFFPEWGYLRENRVFIPGIRFGQLVISMPKWRIVVDDDLKKKNLNYDKLFEKVLNWVRKNKLPDKVVWTNMDREVFIDWSNMNIVLAVWESIRKKRLVEFREYPFEKGSPVLGSDGFYANQVLFSFYKTSR